MEEDKVLKQSSSLEIEKWETEKSFREREIKVKEQEQETKADELALKRKEQASSGWRSPLVVAIIAAALAAGSNAYITLMNGEQERELENIKSEQARILEMIKTGDPDKAAENLDFLLKAGLISQPKLKDSLQKFLSTREPGSGPSLPSETAFPQGIVGEDDARKVSQTALNNALKKATLAVGQIQIQQEERRVSASRCTAFLVGEDLVLTSSFCIPEEGKASLLMYKESKEIPYEVIFPPLESISDEEGLDYVLLRVKGKPGLKHGVLPLSAEAPEINQSLSLLLFRGSNEQLVVTDAPDCKIVSIEEDIFHHRCDSGGGSSGSPILSADGKKVIGLHFGRDQQGGMAVRADKILNRSKILE